MSETINLPPTEPSLPKKLNYYLIVIIVLILLLVALTFAYAYNLGQKNNNQVFGPYPIPANVAYPTSYLSPSPLPTITIDNSPLNPGVISWLSFPLATKLDVFSAASSDTEYRPTVSSAMQVGTFADGSKLINAIVIQEGPGVPYINRYLVTPSGQIYYLSLYNGTDTYYISNLKSNIKFSDLKVDGINNSELITTTKGNFVKTNFFMNDIISFTQVKNPQFLVDSDFGRLYVTYESKKDLPTVSQRQFWLRLKDDTVLPYDLKTTFVTDNQVPNVTWSDGAKNTQAYNIGFRGGCGQTDGKVIKKDTLSSSLSKSGSTATFQEIFSLSNSNDPVVKAIYNSLDPTNRPDYNTFLSQHSHFLWQDSLGDWLIFINQTNQIQAECGKPVIYLYPTTDQTISVKVGAHITKSEPNYPQEGWQVLAHPNGQLEYQGQSYPNLFWEGTGFGSYPDVGKYGFVVPQSKLISTLKSQLFQLGLNSSESKDFLDFWTNKLPSTPYVRLTWLTTSEMNRLAPLQVSPSPKTTIRLFLDFEGLNKSIDLIPQKLTAPVRSGFTLVEWGGLLRK